MNTLLADTLRSILGRQFGFLEWNSAGAAPWTAEVRVVQSPGSQFNFALQVVLLGADHAVLRTSDGLPFESYAQVADVEGVPVSVIGARWAHEIDQVLSVAANRASLVDSVFRWIPLTAVNVTVERTNMRAQIPLQGSDLRAEASTGFLQDVRFEWQIDSLISGRTVARGSFGLGNCLSILHRPAFQCDIQWAEYGSNRYRSDSLATLVHHAELRPPAFLFVTQYAPARNLCGVSGIRSRL